MKKRPNAPRSRVSAPRASDSASRKSAERPIDAFMATLEHPLKAEIEAVRAAILEADSGIVEDDVKWNSLSFRTTDFFATVHLRSTHSVLLVFYLGVKKKSAAVKVSASVGSMRWADANRCLVDLGAGENLMAQLPALSVFVREWIRFV